MKNHPLAIAARLQDAPGQFQGAPAVRVGAQRLGLAFDYLDEMPHFVQEHLVAFESFGSRKHLFCLRTLREAHCAAFVIPIKRAVRAADFQVVAFGPAEVIQVQAALRAAIEEEQRVSCVFYV